MLTFMAKPSSGSCGNSSHLHVSLHDLTGKNVFPSEIKDPSGEFTCSDTMLHFLGGMMKYSLETFILFAPTINSYRRFK